MVYEELLTALQKEMIVALYRSQVEQERNFFIKGPVVLYRREGVECRQLTYLSANSREALGISPIESPEESRPYQLLIHEKDREQVKAVMDKALAKGEGHISHAPYRLIRDDGRVVWVDDHLVITRNNSGNLIRCEGYLYNITDRMTIEQELAQLNLPI